MFSVGMSSRFPMIGRGFGPGGRGRRDEWVRFVPHNMVAAIRPSRKNGMKSWRQKMSIVHVSRGTSPLWTDGNDKGRMGLVGRACWLYNKRILKLEDLTWERHVTTGDRSRITGALHLRIVERTLTQLHNIKLWRRVDPRVHSQGIRCVSQERNPRKDISQKILFTVHTTAGYHDTSTVRRNFSYIVEWMLRTRVASVKNGVRICPCD